MSQAASSSYSGNVSFGTDEAARPKNWALIIGLAVAGLVLIVWLNRK